MKKQIIYFDKLFSKIIKLYKFYFKIHTKILLQGVYIRILIHMINSTQTHIHLYLRIDYQI